MRYTPNSTDTLLSIAERFTLSPAYASAIGEFNGIYTTDAAYDAVPYPVTFPVRDATSADLEIPDAWLKSSTTGAGGSIMASLTANPALFLGLGALALFAFMPRKR